jgi:hypothetical protein
MRIPGFSAAASVYRGSLFREAQTRVFDHSPNQVTPAYYCFPFQATCDCFDFWDCVKCNIYEYPRPCKNPFE